MNEAEIEKILCAIEEKRLCISKIKDLIDQGEVTPEIAEFFRKIRCLQNEILRLQGIKI